ncbi:MAG TPA: MFS transporter [Frankiaceae bacterium]|nr:MFS transporter [Frankiaceae bacterium]
MRLPPDLIAVLRERQFLRLWSTRLSAQAADGIFQVALASFVLFSPDKQATAGKTAAAFATLLLPYSVVGPFAGVFIDRWRRRTILVRANLVRAALTAAVALLIGNGVDNAAFYVTTLAVLSVNRFFLSALSASLPHVVDEGRLVVANSVSTTSGTVMAVAGGGIGYGIGWLAGGGDAGSAAIVLAAGLGYVLSSYRASRMHPDLLGPDPDDDQVSTKDALRGVLGGITAGARHVWQRRSPAYALLAISAHRFFYGLSTVATLLLYRNYFTDEGFFRAGLDGLGQVFAASAVGVLSAAVVTPIAVRRIGKETWIVALLAGACVVEIAFGFPYTQPAFLAAALLLGFVAQGTKICVDTIVQTSVTDAYRGRVFAFYDILFNVTFVSAATLAALILPNTGKSYGVLTLIALGYGATALGYLAVTGPRAPGAEAAASGSR